MPDPWRDVRPGERIQIGARVWNAMKYAARAEQARRFGRSFGDLTSSVDASIVFVRNDCESDLDRYTVLGLSGPVFDPAEGFDSELAFLRNVVFSGTVPNVTVDRGKFCILLEPAPMGRVVRAYVAGVCPVLVDVADVGHTYADILDGEVGGLGSAPDGGAQMLWKETDGSIGYGYGYTTGIQWAIVRLGRTGSVADFKTTSTITKRVGTTLGTGTATRQAISASGVYTDTGVSYTIKSKWSDKQIASGSYVSCAAIEAVWMVLDVDDCAHLS